MNLQFLGIGGAFYPELGNTSAYFIHGRTLFLLDCGGTVFKALHRLSIWGSFDEIILCLSHLHADHSGSIGTLVSYCKHAAKKKIALLHPEEKLSLFMDCIGIRKEDYTFLQTSKYKNEDVSVDFIPVSHTSALNAFGMLIACKAETIYYSGDAQDIPEAVMKRFLDNSVQRIYQDMAFLTSEPKGHGSYALLCETIPCEHRKNIFPIHWDTDARAIIAEDGFGLAITTKEM